MTVKQHFRGHKQSDVRTHNMLTLLRLIRDSGPVSRTDLVELTGLSKATVSILIRDLEEMGVLVSVGAGRAAIGPKPRLLSFRHDFGHVIGIDFSDTRYSAALVDLNGHITGEPIDGNVEKGKHGLLKTVSNVVEALKAVAVKGDYNVCGIGIAISGLIDSERGMVHSSTVFDVTDMPLQAELERRFDLPVRIDGDVNVRLVAEESQDDMSWVGRNIVYVYVGTGVGAGIYIENDVHRGTSGLIGEIGHIPVVGSDLPCACGKIGCLEAVASWPKLTTLARKTGFVGAADMTPEDVVQAAVAGNVSAVAACAQMAHYLSFGLATLANVLNPSLIILGGKLDEWPGLFYPMLRQGLNEKALPQVAAQVELRMAQAGALAGVKGTAGLLFPVVLSQLVASS